MFIRVRPEIKAGYAEIQGYILCKIPKGRGVVDGGRKEGTMRFGFITIQGFEISGGVGRGMMECYHISPCSDMWLE